MGAIFFLIALIVICFLWRDLMSSSFNETEGLRERDIWRKPSPEWVWKAKFTLLVLLSLWCISFFTHYVVTGG